MNELIVKFQELNFQNRLSVIANKTSLASKTSELKGLEEKMLDDNFWNLDEDYTQRILQSVSQLKKVINSFNELIELKDNLEAILELLKEENDEEFVLEFNKEFKIAQKSLESLELITYFSGENDKNGCFFSINAGAGGTESCDWADMLYRMYTRWFEQMKFKVNLLDIQSGDVAGIKSCNFYLQGDYAYGHTRSEHGVHRLVRISPFDSNGRRHTSFASIDVIPEIEENILEIEAKDLRIDTFRASGAGGQHVNTTDSAIRITHIPTGTVVSCQMERSQHKNRATAIKMLHAKLQLINEQENKDKLEAQSQEKGDNAWGNQIRSYVLHPYKRIKDLRTQYETSNVNKVLDGELDDFVYSYLKSSL